MPFTHNGKSVNPNISMDYGLIKSDTTFRLHLTFLPFKIKMLDQSRFFIQNLDMSLLSSPVHNFENKNSGPVQI